MKIRNILFGYRYTEGKLVFHPTESEVMKEIYKAYLEGNSLLKLSERLNERQIEYMPGVGDYTAWSDGINQGLCDY